MNETPIDEYNDKTIQLTSRQIMPSSLSRACNRRKQQPFFTVGQRNGNERHITYIQVRMKGSRKGRGGYRTQERAQKKNIHAVRVNAVIQLYDRCTCMVVIVDLLDSLLISHVIQPPRNDLTVYFQLPPRC